MVSLWWQPLIERFARKHRQFFKTWRIQMQKEIILPKCWWNCLAGVCNWTVSIRDFFEYLPCFLFTQHSQCVVSLKASFELCHKGSWGRMGKWEQCLQTAFRQAGSLLPREICDEVTWGRWMRRMKWLFPSLAQCNKYTGQQNKRCFC